tara:strand:+ start:2249 stop:3502 length:1254 start_codon:yes stop_codon:yes gene_type:complete
MGKNILVIGGGGREHSISLGLKKSAKVNEIHIAPGNAGTLNVGKNHEIDILDNEQVINLVNEFSIDLVIIGPEAPLVNGLSDRLSLEKVLCFGPFSSGAKLEGSKQYAKEIMKKLNIPTANSTVITNSSDIEKILDEYGPNWVIKRDVLAGGKGVTVTSERHLAVNSILEGLNLDGFVLVEEFLEGEEASMLVIMDESGYVCLPASQDHKRLTDGDKGPNTGGMGAYAPAPIISKSVTNKILERIVQPMHMWLSSCEDKYRGCLYVGLMIDKSGDPFVVEYNVRFGDPETQVTIPLISSDLYDLFSYTAEGRIKDLDVTFYEKHALTVVLASEGYPKKPVINRRISGLKDDSENIVVHHAGTKIDDNGNLVSNGGRVLSVTGISDSLSESARISYELINNITLEGSHFRKDIGFRTL